jgi:hypothetical protein
MSKQDSLTAEELHRHLDYNPSTGKFRRAIGQKRSPVGVEISVKQSTNGYFYICILGKKRLAHRLAWLHFYGEYPPTFIDHINGDKTDNRIENLRPASYSENSQNQRSPRSDNKLGVLGVCRSANKFKAQIRIDGRTTYIGLFESVEEARLAYVNAKRKHHPACTL